MLSWAIRKYSWQKNCSGNNPDFFKGTAIEQAVADELGRKTPLAAAKA